MTKAEDKSTPRSADEFVSRMMSNLDGEKDAEIARLRCELGKAKAALEEIEDLGADGCTAARLGNIAHAALLELAGG